MKHCKFYLIIFALLLISCSRHENINGIWIGKYQISEVGNSHIPLLLPVIIEISGSTMHTYRLEFDQADNRRHEIYNIRTERDCILLDKDTLHFKISGTGELILYNYAGNSNKTVFTRVTAVDTSLSVNLGQKAYLFYKDNRFIDSLDFINDSLVMSLLDNCPPDERILRYKILKYRAFNFLITSSPEIPPLLFTSRNDQQYFLKECYISEKQVMLKPIGYYKDTSGMQGTWQVKLETGEDSSLARLQRDLYYEEPHEMSLIITQDSISFCGNGYSKSYQWYLNNTGEWFYFQEKNNSAWQVWKITFFDSKRMVLKRNRMPAPDSDNKNRYLILYKV